jgi:hypothetical protein
LIFAQISNTSSKRKEYQMQSDDALESEDAPEEERFTAIQLNDDD